MARRKGTSKAKTAPRKAPTPTVSQSDNSKTVKDTGQLKDDPGGGGGRGENSKSSLKHRNQQSSTAATAVTATPSKSTKAPNQMGQLSEKIQTQMNEGPSIPITPSIQNRDMPDSINRYIAGNRLLLAQTAPMLNSSGTASSAVDKYLHKKFKRMASTTLQLFEGDDATSTASATQSMSCSEARKRHLASLTPPRVLYPAIFPHGTPEAMNKYSRSPPAFSYPGCLTNDNDDVMLTTHRADSHRTPFELSKSPLMHNNHHGAHAMQQQSGHPSQPVHLEQQHPTDPCAVPFDRQKLTMCRASEEVNVIDEVTYVDDDGVFSVIGRLKEKASRMLHEDQQHTRKDFNMTSVFGRSPDRLSANQPILISSSSSTEDIHHAQGRKSTKASAVPTTTASTSRSGKTDGNKSQSNQPGRYVCPYCQLNCTKPSVLRKHIRAHTNERPYPCALCGFAFKTRSNLYKHFRSRTHTLKVLGELPAGGKPAPPFDGDEASQGGITDPEHDLSSSSTTASSDLHMSRPTSPNDDRDCIPPFLSQTTNAIERPYKPKFHMGLYSNDSSCSSTGATINSANNTPLKAKSPALALTAVTSPALAPMPSHPQTTQSSQTALRSSISSLVSSTVATPSTSSTHLGLSTQSVEYLKDHISKIISQNEAIVEVVEPVLQKKYHKIRSLSRGNSLNSMTDTLPLFTSSSSRASATTTVTSAAQSKAPIDDTLSNIPCMPRAPLARSDSTSSKPDSMTPSARTGSPMTQRKALPTLQQQAQMVLQQNHIDSGRKRTPSTASANSCISISSTSTTPLHTDTSSPQENLHPQNPERSIIKSLLLNSRGLAVPTTGEGEDAVYTCPLCKITFRSADNLQYHTKCYCQGTPITSTQQQQQNESPHSAPISPVGSPSHKYFRSNSFSVCLPEIYMPNTLAKLASSSLRHPHRTPLTLAKLAAQQANPHLKSPAASSSSVSSSGRLRPENIVINTSTCPAPSPISHSTATAHPSSSLSVSSQCVQITKQLIDAALPSPGPLLGKTRLVDTHTNGLNDFVHTMFSESENGPALGYIQSLSPSSAITITPLHNSIVTNSDGSSTSKRPRLSNYPITSMSVPLTPSSTNTSFGPAFKEAANPSRLQMCGGIIKIVPKSEESQPRFGPSGGSIITISPKSEANSEASPLIRTGLNSGGSIIETPKKTLSPSPTPSDLSTKSANTGSLRAATNMNYFQFPPINSITGFNPLTLPPVTATPLNSIEPTKIFHGGKFIPFVQGMPGPNTPSQVSSLTQPCLLPYRGEFQVPQHMPTAGRTRSPSPNSKKIVPSSPIAIRASVSPTSRFATFAKSPFVSPQGPWSKSFPKMSSPAPSEDEFFHATPSAFSGLFNSFSPAHAIKHYTNAPPWNASASPLHKPQELIAATSCSSAYAIKPFTNAPPWHPPASPLHKPQEPIATNRKKSFNFLRIADNLSPMKPKAKDGETNEELRHFNFEKAEDMLRSKQDMNSSATSPLHIDVSERSVPSSHAIPSLVVPDSCANARIEINEDAPLKPRRTSSTKFLRPSSLPLKPGTFTPKMHHGITPTANTLPLISPETPRPSKSCVQLYLNGHAYTYLGLKCSTKPFYCTVNRPQPSHFTSQPKLSIYSNWQVCAENNPHPLGLSPKEAMSLYDSRQRLQQCRRLGKYSVAKHDSACTTLHSQSQMAISSPFDGRSTDSLGVEPNALKSQSHVSSDFSAFDQRIKKERNPKVDEFISSNSNSSDDIPKLKITKLSPKQEPNLSGSEEHKMSDDNASSVSSSAPTSASEVGNVVPPAVPGGYESNEDYTYVRGRGRGKFVCSECGIRCKKPSMLKKHIRTHSDVRPYTCITCDFSFKTKGNLTKHMKSKAHYKKCTELGLNPWPATIDDDSCLDDDHEDSSMASSSCGERTNHMADGDDDSDTDDISDGEDGENESTDTEERQFRLPEHEAARCLLSLSQTPPTPSHPLASPGGQITSTVIISGQQSPAQSISPNSFASSESSARPQRRPMPFGSPPPQQRMTTEPQLLKSVAADENAGSLMPIDLTNKKTAKEGQRKRTVALLPPVTSAYAGPAAFLSSLMCITEKVSSVNALPHNGDYATMAGLEPISLKVNNNDVLMQNYITERAMQDTKIKRSQMSRDSSRFAENAPFVETVGGATCLKDGEEKHSTAWDKLEKIGQPPMASSSHPNNRPGPNLAAISKAALPTAAMSNAVPEVSFPMAPKQPPIKPSPIAISVPNHQPPASEKVKIIQTELSTEDVNLAIQKHFEQSNVRFGIDTLAEIAASSSKLDTNASANRSQPAKSPMHTSMSSAVAQPENNAKNVASEYLKMTSVEYLKAHNPNAIINGVVTSTNKFFHANDREITSEKASTVAKPLDSNADAENNDDLLKLQPHAGASASERGPAAPATALISARTVVVGESGFKTKSSASSELPVMPFVPATTNATSRPPLIQDDGGRCVCPICFKTFLKKSQLTLHMNIHYVNAKKFFCETCGLNLKTQGSMQKHERSESHKREVMKTTALGQETKTNPRPFECSDCNTGFRIHGHLAKHLRSKTHVQKLENLQKLPFGTYAEIERAGISLTDINTTDCESSLDSLKTLAQKLLVDKEPGDRPLSAGDAQPTAERDNRGRTESNSDDGGENIESPNIVNGLAESPGRREESFRARIDDDVPPIKRHKSNNASESSVEPENIKSP